MKMPSLRMEYQRGGSVTKFRNTIILVLAVLQVEVSLSILKTVYILGLKQVRLKIA